MHIGECVLLMSCCRASSKPGQHRPCHQYDQRSLLSGRYVVRREDKLVWAAARVCEIVRGLTVLDRPPASRDQCIWRPPILGTPFTSDDGRLPYHATIATALSVHIWHT
ncbi:hypothetical protein BD310DRAFT_296696 [Dichomitus squalens]|uniref:Uncharacterized protein n=1 Tax=Dichomitus squalens TaxID=114155 RepID=A0A4Q9QBD2_9APHY|nr:hypothetical protein BD310DRAFT_296696 [Dichomitus squalens]